MSKLRIKGQVVVPFTLVVDGEGVSESDLRRIRREFLIEKEAVANAVEWRMSNAAGAASVRIGRIAVEFTEARPEGR